MNTFRLLSKDDKEEITQTIKEYLPENTELALLSFTGSRAFGWGREDSSDIDVHGMFASDGGWFYKCHTRDFGNYDITLKNIKSLDDPEYDEYRWKQYYDMSNPFYINDDFDFYGDFMDDLCPEKVHNIYPYDVQMQRSRYDNGKSARNALHTYKEYMIALNYLWYDEVETNIVEINEKDKFQLDGLQSAVDEYKTGDDIDEATIEQDLDLLDNQLEQALPEENFRDKRRKL